MSVSEIKQNTWFEKDFPFTANGVASDPDTVTFTVIDPDGGLTSDTGLTDEAELKITNPSVGTWRIRLKMTGVLGAYAYTVLGTWTDPPIGDVIQAGVIDVVDAAQKDFHYTPEAVDDVTRVRFNTADTVEATAFWSDAEIEMQIDEDGGDYKRASISLLGQALTKIGREPDLTADWLRVSWGNNLETLKFQIEELKTKWGLGYKHRGRSRKVSRRND